MDSAEERFAVAVIGMDGRFPGASSIEAYWDNLCAGRESITRFRDDQLDHSISEALRADRAYVPARGVLEDALAFDAGFFGITPREAELMDPQQRVFLELCWSTLERAGYDPARVDGSVGVYAGMANNTYYPTSVLAHPEKVQRFGEFQTMLANEKDFLATRVSHKLDLHGPSISLYTGCSTSLVAVAQAFHALLSYQTDMALAGGICVTMPQNTGYLHRPEGIESADGHCRPFDAGATGTVFSNGAGVVLLKRLDDALRDGDSIHAVLVGAALNNDGADKVGFAAPSVAGQAEVIADALAQGDVDPASVGFIEAHGTATALGDPVEVEGLRQAFRYPQSGQGFCALGSVKGNFGHLLAAAGVTGLIKAVLAVKHGVVPPTVNFDTPNPGIELERSPFFINVEPVPFPDRGGPRRAGVSSFGIGGTNAHVVIEQAPETAPARTNDHPELLLVSGRSEMTLSKSVSRLADCLEANPDLPLDSVAFTLQVGRRAFPHRSFVVVENTASAPRALRKPDPNRAGTAHQAGESPRVLFLFPGMGSQYDGMGAACYANDATYRSVYDQCARHLANSGLAELQREMPRSDSLPRRAEACANAPAPPRLGLGGVDTEVLTLFVSSYALARTWIEWGVRPSALLGHSLGDLVAACVAEVLRPEDALTYLVRMAEVAEAAPEGRMLAVRLERARLEAYVEGMETVCVAADNSPTLSLASGARAEIETLVARLASDGVPHRQLPGRRAFHSPAFDAASDELWDVAAGLKLGRPRIPWYSSITGRLIDTHTASDPSYWARHPRSTVRFRQAVAAALKGGATLALESGPGSTLGVCVRQVAGREGPTVVHTLPDEATTLPSEWSSVLSAAGHCWLAGCDIDWTKLHATTPRRACLPTYPFERVTHGLPTRPAIERKNPALEV
ncbi:MAG: type I polyketide synthase [Xanthomonadales bacterium]|nr:type I polyketide synthase [Xanthomonadales bacterium]